MKKPLSIFAALLISTSASAQLDIPAIGGIFGSTSSPSSGISLDGLVGIIEADSLGFGSSASSLQSMGAPFLMPVLLQIAPLVDLGPASPALAPLLQVTPMLPGLPNLDF